MDRNKHPEPTKQTQRLVALRKESVDRNEGPAPLADGTEVALRKESVDRNTGG